MNLKAHMHDNLTSVHPRCARRHPGRHEFFSGFSVCLLLVVLAVCGWVMHRRLSQYETPQAVHQSTSIKVCVTKRNPISVPSMRGTDAFAIFLLAYVFAVTFISPGNSKATLAFRVQRDALDRCADASMRPSLAHFFFLPPPSYPSVL
jgi:hypothetical protein